MEIIMMSIRKLIAIIGILYFGIQVFLGILSIYDFLTDPSDIMFLYNVGPNGYHWQFKSSTNLVIYDVGLIILQLVFLIIFSRFLFNTKLKYWVLGILMLTVTLIVRDHILWVRSGYDHYPGYDPYFF